MASSAREYMLRHAAKVLRPCVYATYCRIMMVYGNPKGRRFWPAQVTMAAELELADSTLRAHLREMAATGVLRIERSRPYRGEGGRYTRRRCNRYVPQWPAQYRPKPAKGQVPPTAESPTLYPLRIKNPPAGGASHGPHHRPARPAKPKMPPLPANWEAYITDPTERERIRRQWHL